MTPASEKLSGLAESSPFEERQPDEQKQASAPEKTAETSSFQEPDAIPLDRWVCWLFIFIFILFALFLLWEPFSSLFQ